MSLQSPAAKRRPSASFEGAARALAVTFATLAVAKYHIASEIRWLRIAVEAAAFGGLQL